MDVIILSAFKNVNLEYFPVFLLFPSKNRQEEKAKEEEKENLSVLFPSLQHFNFELDFSLETLDTGFVRKM